MNGQSRRGISRTKLVAGGFLWAAVIVSLIAVNTEAQNDASAEAVEAGQGTTGTSADNPVKPGQKTASVKLSFPARKLPNFEFESTTGGTVSLESLRGQRWVASFVFSRCTTSCPVITKAVMGVHDRVKKDAPDVHFVSITVDPKFDTAEIFHEYAQTFTRGDHSRWSFLTGDQQQIYELVVSGFGLYVKENVGESRLPGLEVAHTNRVVLVNEEGTPVGTFLGTRADDMSKLSRILAGKEDFPQPGPPLSITTADGQPMPIQFEVQPADASTADEETSQSGASQTKMSDNDSPDERAATAGVANSDDTDVAESGSVAEHNAAIDLRLPAWAKRLPALNAGLNTLAALLLIWGLMAIKTQRRELHRNLMVTAFLVSVVFLASYLTYHYALGKYTSEHGRRFSGEGAAAIVYYLILWPHVILAAFVPFLAMRVLFLAAKGRWDAHKKLARVTFPIWMFVSVTGVVIYGMLYHWPAG